MKTVLCHSSSDIIIELNRYNYWIKEHKLFGSGQQSTARFHVADLV